MNSRIARVLQARNNPVNAQASAKAERNRRFTHRKPVDWSGLIASSTMSDNVACVVRDVSSTGALVELVADKKGPPPLANDLPDRFTLGFISYKECSEVSCLVMWRRGLRLGVRYTSPFRRVSKPVPAKMPVRAKR